MSTITVIRHSTCSPVMDKADDQSDKDERKREVCRNSHHCTSAQADFDVLQYNRLAQREFSVYQDASGDIHIANAVQDDEERIISRSLKAHRKNRIQNKQRRLNDYGMRMTN